MAQGSKIFKTRIQISDSDRHCYEEMTQSLVLHPSEKPERLLARLIAFALEFQPELEFGRGISNTDEAPIWVRDLDGRVEHWIDVGQPEPERFSKLSKRCGKVSLYCFGANANRWWQQHQNGYAKLPMQVFMLDWDGLEQLAAVMQKGLDFQLVRSDNHLYLTLNDQQVEMVLQPLQSED
ncbi:MAG: YaeQ family protein [Motiliproteus sp.]|nr:YaeQ family protein [Motiliproteus sp.]MCW9051590.1 YaeQ family protein [Motiliproteus sp.]